MGSATATIRLHQVLSYPEELLHISLDNLPYLNIIFLLCSCVICTAASLVGRLDKTYPAYEFLTQLL